MKFAIYFLHFQITRIMFYLKFHDFPSRNTCTCSNCIYLTQIDGTDIWKAIFLSSYQEKNLTWRYHLLRHTKQKNAQLCQIHTSPLLTKRSSILVQPVLFWEKYFNSALIAKLEEVSPPFVKGNGGGA